MDADPAELVGRYYDALDERAADELRELLAPGFVQRRPDRTFEDRGSFVRFMREERPTMETSHEILEVLEDENRGTVAVRGRLRDEDGVAMFEFADHFETENGRIVRLETYTR